MAKINWQDILGWGDDEMSDLRFIGYSYIKQGHYKIALKFFDALVVLNPNSAYDLQTLGALHLQLGDNLSALNYLEQSLRIDAMHPPTLLNRAKALLMLGYQKQGLLQAEDLKDHPNAHIANQAQAILLSYS